MQWKEKNEEIRIYFVEKKVTSQKNLSELMCNFSAG